MSAPGRGVPAGPIRTHLRRLVRCGATAAWIAQQSGVTERTVRAVLTGERLSLYRGTATLLLAVHGDPPPSARRTEPGPTIAQGDELLGRHWPLQTITRLAGLGPGTLMPSNLTTGVSEATAAAVARVHAALAGRDGPGPRPYPHLVELLAGHSDRAVAAGAGVASASVWPPGTGSRSAGRSRWPSTPGCTNVPWPPERTAPGAAHPLGMSSTPTLSPGGLALAAAEHVTAHPGTSTADLIGALAPYTEVPHVRVLEVVHRHSRSLGFGQGSDLRWYAAPDSAEIAAAVRADAPGPMVQPYLDACRELEAVVSVGRSTRVLNALGQALLADAGVDLDRCGLQHEPILADQRQRNLGVAGQAGAGSVAR